MFSRQVYTSILLSCLICTTGLTIEVEKCLQFRVIDPVAGLSYEKFGLTAVTTGWVLKTTSSTNGLDHHFFQHTWQVTDKREQNQFTAQLLQTGKILLYGLFKGKKLEKEYQIDDAPWLQYPEVSLAEFIAAGEKQQLFWIISLHDLKIFKFKATKQGQERLIIDNQTVDCLKVRIQPTGLFSIFWHATYWFRLTDGSCLRYQASHGPPGTAVTTKERL
jgi:hypothetical protein